MSFKWKLQTSDVRYDDYGVVWAPERPDYEAFFKAASAGDLEDVKIALDTNIKVDALQGDGWEGETALHMASAAGNVDIVELLIARGATVDIHDRSPHGPSTPLHDAAFFGRARVVEALLDHGADIKAVGEMDGTVLQQVLRNKKHVEPHHIETIILLLDRGHDIHAGSMELGGTVVNRLCLHRIFLLNANKCSFIKPQNSEALNSLKYSSIEAPTSTSTSPIARDQFFKPSPNTEIATQPSS